MKFFFITIFLSTFLFSCSSNNSSSNYSYKSYQSPVCDYQCKKEKEKELAMSQRKSNLAGDTCIKYKSEYAFCPVVPDKKWHYFTKTWDSNECNYVCISKKCKNNDDSKQSGKGKLGCYGYASSSILGSLNEWWSSPGKIKKPKYSAKEKDVIATCVMYSKELNNNFSGDLETCYAFLNEYKESINRKTNKMLPLYANALSRTRNSNKVVLLNFVKTNVLTFPCRYKTFNKSHDMKYLINCLSRIKMLPEELMMYVNKTNDHANMQAARAIRSQKLIALSNSLMKLSAGYSNNAPVTKGSGFTKVCYYDQGRHAITVGSIDICPLTTPKTQMGFTKVCLKDTIGGQVAITIQSMEFCPLGYKQR